MKLSENKDLAALSAKYERARARRKRKIDVSNLAFSSIAPEVSKRNRDNMPKRVVYEIFIFGKWQAVPKENYDLAIKQGFSVRTTVK